MTKIKYRCGSYSIDEDKVPIPEKLKNKDIRADSAALAAVWAATNIINGVENLELSELNIIILNREGCESHLERVKSNMEKRMPAQGFFVRSGPQTLATYTALALGSHGSAFTIIGHKSVLEEAISAAVFLSNSSPSSNALLIVISKNKNSGYLTKAVLIGREIKNEKDDVDLAPLENIYRHLSSAFNVEMKI